MRISRTTSFVFVSLIAATPVAAQPSEYTVVPVDQRLQFGDVFADASILNQAIMGGLTIAALTALIVWSVGLRNLSGADAKRLAKDLGALKAIRSAAPLIGLFGASYTLLSAFIGVANVRPSPSFTVLAPGYAEATLQVMLGLLAASIAALLERHLESRLRAAAA